MSRPMMIKLLLTLLLALLMWYLIHAISLYPSTGSGHRLLWGTIIQSQGSTLI